MQREQAITKAVKQARLQAKSKSRESEKTAKDFWQRWRDESREKIEQALKVEVAKVKSVTRLAEVLAFAQILNKVDKTI